jgi:hypothetical protein
MLENVSQHTDLVFCHEEIYFLLLVKILNNRSEI